MVSNLLFSASKWFSFWSSFLILLSAFYLRLLPFLIDLSKTVFMNSLMVLVYSKGRPCVEGSWVSWVIVILMSFLFRLAVYCNPSCFFSCLTLCLEMEDVEEQKITCLLLVISFSPLSISTRSQQNYFFSSVWQSMSFYSTVECFSVFVYPGGYFSGNLSWGMQ